VKVFGVTTMLRGVRNGPHSQVRAVVAASTKKEAARLLAMPISEFNRHGCETGNQAEIDVALAEPGAVFWKPAARRGPDEGFERWDTELQAEAIAQRVTDAEARVAMRERVAQNRAAAASRNERQAQADRAAKALLERHSDLLAEYGVRVTTNGDGNVTLPAEQLVGLLAQLR
jgi:hypothetical protein